MIGISIQFHIYLHMRMVMVEVGCVGGSSCFPAVFLCLYVFSFYVLFDFFFCIFPLSSNGMMCIVRLSNQLFEQESKSKKYCFISEVHIIECLLQCHFLCNITYMYTMKMFYTNKVSGSVQSQYIFTSTYTYFSIKQRNFVGKISG